MASPSEPAMRVLLTGAESFTGQYLIPVLQSLGFEVHGSQHPASTPLATPAPKDCPIHVLDLLDKSSVQALFRELKPTHVINLAAMSHVTRSAPEDYYRVNTVAAVQLLEAAAETGGLQAALLPSSAAIYGNPASVEWIDEKQPPAPLSHYGCSKWAMECMAQTFADRFPVVLTRPFNYTGVGQTTDFLIPKIVAHFAQKHPSLPLGNIDVVRDFSDVRTVAKIYSHLLLHPDATAPINVCRGEGHSIAQVIGLLEKLTGHHLNIEVQTHLVRTSDIKRSVGRSRSAEVRQLASAIPLETTLKWMLEASYPS